MKWIISAIFLASVAVAIPRVRRQSGGDFWWLTTEIPASGTGELSDPKSNIDPNTNVDPNIPSYDYIDGVDPLLPSNDYNTNVDPNVPSNVDNANVNPGNIGDLLDAFIAGIPPPKTTSGDCICVPYYQCREGDIITDGSGLIDIRFGASLNDTTSERINSNSKCDKYLDVCCNAPTHGKPEDPLYEPSCGRRNRQGVHARVSGFNNNEAQFGELPWMVAVLRKELVVEKEVNLYVCGGSLIYPNIVLTAAHCVNNWKNTPDVLKVRLGEWDTQQTYELYGHHDREVSFVVTHPEFNSGSLFNDFAILVLSQPAALGPNVDTICLPGPYTNFDYQRCFASGWGKDQFGKEGTYQNVLKLIDLPVVPHKYCQYNLTTTRLGTYFKLHDSFLCAGGEPGKDTCKGDGGSPLVCEVAANDGQPEYYVQAGIVAWGIGCGETGIPGVYADVGKGIEWIQSALAPYISYN